MITFNGPGAQDGLAVKTEVADMRVAIASPGADILKRARLILGFFLFIASIYFFGQECHFHDIASRNFS